MVEIVVLPIRVCWKIFLLTYCRKLKSSIAYLKNFANTNSRKDRCILLVLFDSRYYYDTLLYRFLQKDFPLPSIPLMKKICSGASDAVKMKGRYLRTFAYCSTRCIFRNARIILVVI